MLSKSQYAEIKGKRSIPWPQRVELLAEFCDANNLDAKQAEKELGTTAHEIRLSLQLYHFMCRHPKICLATSKREAVSIMRAKNPNLRIRALIKEQERMKGREY